MTSDTDSGGLDDTVVSPCSFCALPTSDTDSVPCSDCNVIMHWKCRTGTRQKKPAENINALLGHPWVRILCDRCVVPIDARAELNPDDIGSGSGNGQEMLRKISASFGDLKKQVSQLTTTMEAQKTSLASLASLSAALDSGTATTHRKGSSYATAATKGLPSVPPVLVASMTKALRDSNEEELRQRSLVIDQMEEVDGESDTEKINAFIAFAGLNDAVRVEQAYRMGEKRDGERPRKVKLVLCTPNMQRLLLTKEIRETLRRSNCPAPLRGTFLNPSRPWEERRLLMKLRIRRNELNRNVPDTDSQWFLDYSRSLLVKRANGSPEWKGVGDIGWGKWAESYDRAHPPRSRNTASSTPQPPIPSPRHSRPPKTLISSSQPPNTTSTHHNSATQQPPQIKN